MNGDKAGTRQMRKVGKVQQLIGCGRRKAEEPEKTLEISEEGGWKPRLAVGAEGSV